MCQALRELMKDEIETEINEAENRVKLEDIRGIMEAFSVTAEQAMDAQKYLRPCELPLFPCFYFPLKHANVQN